MSSTQCNANCRSPWPLRLQPGRGVEVRVQLDKMGRAGGLQQANCFTVNPLNKTK